MDARARLEATARDLEQPGALGEAALLIAAEEHPDVNLPPWLRTWLGRLDNLGLRAREVVSPRLDAEEAAVALNRLLFAEYGLRGNEADYYDPRNSFLDEVLERRLGIPITLSLVYMEVAARAGVTVRGVGLPGHFVVRLDRGGESRLLDPFHGGERLAEDDCRRLVARLSGGGVRLDPGHFRAVTPREILLRMLGNLKGTYTGLGDWRRARAAVDRILLLAPAALGERRDRGALSVRLGELPAAVRDWEAYLHTAPDAPDAAAVRQRLRAVRQSLASLN